MKTIQTGAVIVCFSVFCFILKVRFPFVFSGLYFFPLFYCFPAVFSCLTIFTCVLLPLLPYIVLTCVPCPSLLIVLVSCVCVWLLFRHDSVHAVVCMAVLAAFCLASCFFIVVYLCRSQKVSFSFFQFK